MNAIARGLLLSGTSSLVCLFAGIITVLVGVLGAAQTQGTDVLSLHLSLAHRLPVIGSLDRLLSHGSWTDIIKLVAWTLVPLIVFGVVELVLGRYADLLESAKKEQRTQPPSEKRWLLVRSYRRFVTGLIAIVCAMLFVQLAHWVSAMEKAAVSDISLTRNTWRMALAALSWAFIYYMVIVFGRLYRMSPKTSLAKLH